MNSVEKNIYCIQVFRIQQDICKSRSLEEKNSSLSRLINQDGSDSSKKNSFNQESIDAFDQFMNFMH